MPEDHTTNWNHCGWCLRRGVKYSQCGIAPEICPHARFTGGVLDHLRVAPGDIDLLAVSERVFVKWPKRPQVAPHGPLVHLLDQFFLLRSSGVRPRRMPRDRPWHRRLPSAQRRRRRRPSRCRLLRRSGRRDGRQSLTAGLRPAADPLATRRTLPRGVTLICDGSSTGARSRRSLALTSGKLQYIITMPEANHSRKRTDSATPNQRWTKISDRLSSTDGRR